MNLKQRLLIVSIMTITIGLFAQNKKSSIKDLELKLDSINKKHY